MCRTLALLFGLAAVGLVGCGEVTSVRDAGGEPGDASDELDAEGPLSCEDCAPNATCEDGGEDISCVCDDGYEGDGVTCEDVNECAEDNGGCDENAICINRPGSRECDCMEGYLGDGETCSRIWTLFHEIEDLRFNPDNYGAGYAAGFEESIYFAPKSNDESVYFKSIDIQTKTVTDLPLPEPDGGDFCACGADGPLVSDADLGLCQFANDANCFDGDTWSAVTRPDEFATDDAASAGIGGFIYEVGANGNTGDAHRYSPESGFEAITDHPAGVHDARGAAHDGVLYVLGGETAAGAENKAFAYDTQQGTAGTWEQLPDIPVDSGSPRGAVAHDGLIFLFNYDEILIYDPAESTWRERRLDYPEGQNFRPASIPGRVFLLGDRDSSLVIYELTTY